MLKISGRREIDRDMEMAGKLEGKVALITGGSSGIGLASAAALRSEGAKLVVGGRDQRRLNEAREQLGGDVLTVRCDVAKLPDIERLIAATRDGYGKIDVLFVNAGMSQPRRFSDVDEDYFDRMTSTNVKGAFFTFARAFPLLSPGASIIFTSSVASGKGSPSDPVYSASKAAVNALARNFAGDRAVLDRGIRVNVVSPGAVRTPLTQGFYDMPEIRGQIEALIPMGRWGASDEIARAVLFLATSDSSYITGSTISVDGGLGQL